MYREDVDTNVVDTELFTPWYSDYPLYAAEMQFIVDKHTHVVPLELSPWQRQDADVTQAMLDIGVPVRKIVDKARQTYISTVECGIGNWRQHLSTTPMKRVIICDEYDKTENLFNMNLRFCELAPVPIAHHPNRSDGTLLYKDSGSILESMTAKNFQTGRSSTIHHLHMSECAFFPRFKEISEGLLGCVPDLPGTSITWESTANGFDAGFHAKWITSIEHSADVVRRWNARNPENPAVDHYDLLLNKRYWDGSYFPIFFSSWGPVEYRREPELEGLTMANASKMERVLMETYGVDLHWCAWRRYIIREKMRGPAVYSDDSDANISFDQEFPLSWEMSFVSTGRSVFPKATVTVQLGKSIENEKKVFISSTGASRRLVQPVDLAWFKRKAQKPGEEDIDCSPRYDRIGRVVNKDELRAVAKMNHAGDHIIYKTPYTLTTKTQSLWEYRYVVGVDIAEGLAQGDYSVITVFDRVTYEFVHLYRVHIGPYELAEEIAKVCSYYDDAWSMGEYNKDGASVTTRLMQFSNKLMPRPEIGKGIDLISPSTAVWYYTTGSDELGKKWAIGMVEELMRQKPACSPYRRFWEEANTFTRDSRGRMGADGKRSDPAVKNFDDVIMASAMALVGHHFLPTPTETRKAIPRTNWEAKKQKEKEQYELARAGASIVDHLPQGVGLEVL